MPAVAECQQFDHGVVNQRLTPLGGALTVGLHDPKTPLKSPAKKPAAYGAPSAAPAPLRQRSAQTHRPHRVRADRGLRLALHHVDVLAGQHHLAALVEQMQRNRRYPINYQGTSCWFNLAGLTSVRCLEGGLAIHGTV